MTIHLDGIMPIWEESTIYTKFQWVKRFLIQLLFFEKLLKMMRCKHAILHRARYLKSNFYAVKSFSEC